MTEHVSDKPKMAKSMTAAERHAALDEIRRAAWRFEPMPQDKMARDMSPAERQQFIRECSKRAG
jgi:hypothetical protein